MSSDKPSLTELLSKAGLSGSLSDTEWKTLSQKLNNLDKVASRTDGPGLEPSGVRWRGQYKFYVDWDSDGAPSPKINYAKNPTFEANVTDDWTFYQAGTGGTFTRDATQAYTGTYSGKVLAGTGLCLAYSTNTIACPNGSTVSISAYVRCSADPTSNKASIYIRNSDSPYDNYAEAAATSASNGAWERLTKSWTNTTGSSKNIDVALENDFSNSSASVWFDGVTLELTSSASAYFDGSLGWGYTWEGTSHNSRSFYYGPWEYTGTYDNMTNRFVSADVRRGLPGPETFCAIPAMIEVVLDNTDGMLTSTNDDSPIQAQIVGSAKKRCKLTCVVSGTEYQLFDGWVKEIAANPDTHGKKMATVVVDDLIGRLKNIPMISSMVKNTTELTLIAQALAGVVPAYYGRAYYGGAYYGYAGAAQDIHGVYGSAQDLFGYGGDSWRESETSVLDAIQDVMSSCLGHFYVTKDGVPTYANRLYRPQNASVTDWDASKVSRIDAIGLFDETLFTEVQLIIQQRREGTTASILWTLRDQPTVPANGSLTYIANFTDPDGGSACGCIYPVTPVRGTDFTNNTNLSVSVAWRGADALVTVSNSSGSGIALTLLQLRGTPVIRLDEMQIKETGSAVPKKTLWHSAPLLTDTTDAQSYVEWLYTIVSFLTDRPRQATIVPDSPATLVEACQLDVDRRIKMVDGSTSFVNWVRHTITPGNHKVEVGTSPAISTTMWTLGLSELGTSTALGV
jgi:hypothetical protein